MFKKVDGKVIVLSDIHYPHCDEGLILSIIRREDPDLVVLLGDIVTERVEGYREFLKRLPSNTVYVKGDGDIIDGDTEYLEVESCGKRFIMFHGHQLLNESTQSFLARSLKRVNYYLPVLGYCLLARLKFPKGYLILGHSHALVNFKKIKCANAGTMSLIKNIYNDRGYLKIVKGRVEVVRL